MKALQVRMLSLWPRFQATVKHDLEQTPIQVIEITQPMSPAMMAIQDAIKELIVAIVQELSKTGRIDRSNLQSDIFKL